MDILDQIVERRIAEAEARGDFEGLPGAGRPLELDDAPLVRPELRLAYRILKNAGYLPDEVQLRAEIGSAERLLAQAASGEQRAAAAARLRLLLSRVGERRGGSLQAEADYFERLVARLGAFRNCSGGSMSVHYHYTLESNSPRGGGRRG